MTDEGQQRDEFDERDVDFAEFNENESQKDNMSQSGERESGESASAEQVNSAESESAESESEALRREVAESRDKYLRALADLENSKRRAAKDRSELLKYQGERIFVDLLEVVDDFDRALEHSEGNGEQFRSGVELIRKKFGEILKKWDVRGESAVGEVFDPAKHSALSRIQVDDAQPGTVISELKKAYFYKDKLLRPAEVVVAEASASEE